MSFAGYLEALRPEVEETLDRLLAPAGLVPGRLHEAMRYAIFAGGKRVRPGLVVLAGEELGASRERLLEAAVALEMIHTFSLIHDDLPALDDDDLRRGRPTLHRAYDEALAVLAGDALLNLGLEVLGRFPDCAPADLRLANVLAVTRAVGTEGMIGGQVEDIEAEGVWPTEAEVVLERIHLRKTAALLSASLEVGATIAHASASDLAAIRELGLAAGLLFQVRDDILDVEGTAEQLGKTPGKDQRANKLTFPALLGMEESSRRIEALRAASFAAIEKLSVPCPLLISLAEFLTRRGS